MTGKKPAETDTIRLLAVDLDGTLLDSEDRMSDVNRRAMRDAAAAGVTLVVASGRIREESQFVLDALPEVRFFIGMNGGRVEEPQSNAVLYDSPLEASEARRLIDFLDASGFFFQIYAEGGVFCLPKSLGHLHDSGMTRHYLARFGESIREWSPETARGRKVYKMLAVAKTPAMAAALKDALAGHDNVRLFSSLPAMGYFEIVPTGIGKGRALAALCEDLGIASRHVLAMGDSENDLDMLEYAGLGVILENADPAFHGKADCVAPSNNDNGVAATIQKYILNKA